MISTFHKKATITGKIVSKTTLFQSEFRSSYFVDYRFQREEFRQPRGSPKNFENPYKVERIRKAVFLHKVSHRAKVVPSRERRVQLQKASWNKEPPRCCRANTLVWRILRILLEYLSNKSYAKSQVGSAARHRLRMFCQQCENQCLQRDDRIMKGSNYQITPSC